MEPNKTVLHVPIMYQPLMERISCFIPRIIEQCQHLKVNETVAIYLEGYLVTVILYTDGLCVYSGQSINKITIVRRFSCLDVTSEGTNHRSLIDTPESIATFQAECAANEINNLDP